MKDIVFDFQNKTMFANGDIRTGESDDQNKRLLLLCEKGSFKEFPTICVGAASYLEGEDNATFLREVRTQFQGDGMTVNKILIEEGKIKVDAKY
jgi:hypothetical protein